mgnify:FL=1
MKFTKKQLKRLIKEELAAVLREGYHHGESDSWEVDINVDYNKEPILTWGIGLKTSTGVNSTLEGSSESLNTDTLENAIRQIIKTERLDVDEADDLKDAFYKAEESFRRER